MRTLARTAASLLLTVAAGCAAGEISGRGGGRDGGLDASANHDGAVTIGDGGGGMSGTCKTSSDCSPGQRCFEGGCIRDNGTCTRDNDCENDSYCDCTQGGGGDMGACMGGVCLPYGVGPRGPYDPSCVAQAFSAQDFKPPVVKCSWTGGQVIMTPLLVDLDLDGKPEIVFETLDGGDQANHLIALQGHDCSVVFDRAVTNMGFSQLAAADLDGDKYPEIVAISSSQTLVIYDHTGAELAAAPTPYNGGGTGSDCTGPAIVEIDGVAPPEIVVAGQVARYTKGVGVQVLFTQPVTPAQWGTLSAAADLDGDNVAEVITGRQVYDGKTGAVKTPAGWSQLTGPGAYPAVADFNKDGKPDVLIVQSESGNEVVSIWDWTNQRWLFGPFTVPNGWGGPATVADFDGDGVPDFGSAGPREYTVFAMKCWPSGGAGCAGPGILWQKTTHDYSSGGTASSVFDFNGDGKAEVVYRDECFLRVYNGPDGKVDFIQQITSGTCLENPVIGDVDGDGHADIVVPSDNVQGAGCSGTVDTDTGTTWSTQTKGIFVLTDPMNRWMPSRGIWNEHTYHITNVNDDATIPYPEKPSWSSWNDYRQNVQGMQPGAVTPGADLTGGQSTMVDNGPSDCKTAERLWAQICNRGTATVMPGISGTFYQSDPRMAGAKAICSTVTKTQLAPGMCEAVYCDWMNPPTGAQDLWFRANDAGSSGPVVGECDADNDLLFLPQVSCSQPG